MPAYSLRQQLAGAIETGEILTVVYRKGSQPGTKRQISPVRLTDEVVLARCLNAGQLRAFRLADIDIVPADHSAPEFERIDANASRALDAINLVLAERDRIAKNGWHVVIACDRIGLHDFNKRTGLPLTYPTIEISRSRPDASRPWTVRGPTRGTGFSLPEKAVAAFIEEAERHGPAAKPKG